MTRLLAIVLLLVTLLGGLFYVDSRNARLELAAAKQEVRDLREINASLTAICEGRETLDSALLTETAKGVAQLYNLIDLSHYETLEMLRWAGQERREEGFGMRLSRVREQWLLGQGGGEVGTER